MPETLSKAVQQSRPVSTQLAGLHIVANFRSDERKLLAVAGPFREFIDKAISETNLNKVGEAYHDFPGGGFTAVVCLAESHLSIHTWPERGYATFDIFLSNFTTDNSPKGKAIYDKVISFFNAEVVFEKTLPR